MSPLIRLIINHWFYHHLNTQHWCARCGTSWIISTLLGKTWAAGGVIENECVIINPGHMLSVERWKARINYSGVYQIMIPAPSSSSNTEQLIVHSTLDDYNITFDTTQQSSTTRCHTTTNTPATPNIFCFSWKQLVDWSARKFPRVANLRHLPLFWQHNVAN